MPKRAEQREATRTAILDAAETAFAERGFAGSRVEGIARGAGIRRASLFHHFPDKQAIYTAVIQRSVLPYFATVDALLARTDSVPSSETSQAIIKAGHEAISQGIALQARFFSAHPQIARIILREVVEDDPDRPSILRAHVTPLIAALTRFLEARRSEGAIEPVDPETLITATAGAALFHVTARPMLPSAGDNDDHRLARHERALSLLIMRLLGMAPESP